MSKQKRVTLSFFINRNKAAINHYLHSVTGAEPQKGYDYIGAIASDPILWKWTNQYVRDMVSPTIATFNKLPFGLTHRPHSNERIRLTTGRVYIAQPALRFHLQEWPNRL